MEEEKNTPTGEPTCTVDPWEYLQITLNPDGTITRHFTPPSSPPSPDPSSTTTSLSKDIPISHENSTWMRLYLPKFALDNPQFYSKLPIVVNCHGGGFVLFSAESKIVHDFCELMASTAGVLVASVEYRLAPEHRLPAAYEDAVDALNCIKDSQDDWISRYGDLSRCFLMGSSAGGNIAYHVGLRAAKLNLGSLKIQGLMLHVPFFGGIDRTESEWRLVNDPYLPLAGTDLMWELSLPIGADRDHEYSNPFKANGPSLLKEMGWKVLIIGWTGDPLIDRQKELAKVMEKKGVDVVAHFTEGGCHGAEVNDPSLNLPFIELIKEFILSNP